jgi:hypothetical protein
METDLHFFITVEIESLGSLGRISKEVLET